MLKKINTYTKTINREYKLTKSEQKILKELLHHEKGLVLNEIVVKTSLARLTALYNLRKLEERNLVYRNKTKKAHVFHSRIKNIEFENITELSPSEAYSILEKTDAKRIIGIQGINAIKEILKTLFSNKKQYAKLHKRQKQRDIIINSIIFEGSFLDAHSLPQEYYKTHLGRPTTLRVLSDDNKKLSNYEVISDGKTLAIINRLSDKAIVVRQRNVIEVIEGLMEIIAASSRSKNIADLYNNPS